MKYQVGCFQHKKVVVKFLWPYNIFYSDRISVILLFVSSIFYSINYLLTVGSLVT